MKKEALIGFPLLFLGLWGCGSPNEQPVQQVPSTPVSTAPAPAAPTPPFIASISPANARAGSTDLTVTISGSNFESAPFLSTLVAWSPSDTVTHCCNTWLLTTFISSTQLTAVIPAALLKSPTTGYLFAETGDLQSITDGVEYPYSNVVAFRVLDEFSATGSMATARSFHAATLLPDGEVLITGGGTLGPPEPDCEDIIALDSAEIYNPGTGRFTLTGNLVAPRFRHTATLLSNGKVLIAGGMQTVVTYGPGVEHCSGPLNSAEIFDPSTGTFTLANSMHEKRAFHTATLLADGRVLIAGGVYLDTPATVPSTAEIFDPATGQFSTDISMTTTRTGHAAVLLSNGQVLLTGGYGPDFSSAEIYDPTSNSFRAVGGMTTERSSHTATVLRDGKVLITGGYINGEPLLTSEIYDPATETFSATGSMRFARFDHRATLLADGRVLITGGAGNSGPLDTAEVFDPATGQFSTPLIMSASRSSHTATRLDDGRVFVVGGGVASAELYQPK